MSNETTRTTDRDGDLISITADANIMDQISNDADLSGELTADLPVGSAGQKITLDVVISGIEFTAIADWNISKFNEDDWVVNDIRTTERNADFIAALIIDYEDPEHAIEPTIEFDLDNIQSVKVNVKAMVIGIQADMHHVNQSIVNADEIKQQHDNYPASFGAAKAQIDYLNQHIARLDQSIAMLAQANGLQG